MAIQGNMKYIGTVDGVIHYCSKGEYYMRTVPEEVNQTQATKDSAAILGNASSIGSVLRHSIESILSNARDKEMQNRFTAAIQAYLYESQGREPRFVPEEERLPTFAFNLKARGNHKLQELVAAEFLPDSGITVSIPAFIPQKTFIAPKGTRALRLIVCATVANWQRIRVTDQYIQVLELEFTGKEINTQNIQLPVTSSLGSIITCTVALQFCKSFNHYAIPVNNLKYLPVVIAGVWSK